MQNFSNVHSVARGLGVLALVSLGSASAVAQNQLVDEVTSLAVRLPAGYSVTKVPPRPRQDVLFMIRSETGQPVSKNRDGSLCGLAFVNTPGNAALSQDEINAQLIKPEWRNMAKATLEMVFDVNRVDGVQLNGIEAVTMHAAPKSSSPDQDVFVHLSMLETPKGRTTLSCVTSKAGAEAALPVFMSILAGVQPPR